MNASGRRQKKWFQLAGPTPVRKQIREIGLDQDSYQPSRMVLALRETHRRLAEEPPVTTFSALRQIMLS